MSSNEENEYFSDGITEEIINALAKLKELKVSSRTSAFYFKGKNIPIKKIGNELGVSTLLEGSVRLSGPSMRITAQLIDAKEDFHFWSETWDRPLDNIFEVQDEISLLIADKLREHFGHFEIQEQLVDKKTDNLDAYNLYLKGRHLFNKWNPEDVKEAMSFYRQALELDPQHAQAMVGLADAHSFLATISDIPFEEGWGKCAELTHQALEINDELAAAYYQLANLAFFTACDYRSSFEKAKHALQLNNNHIESQQFMAFLYILAGKKELAKEHLKIALDIDPFSQETLFFSAYVEYMLENYSESLQQLDACLEVNPMNIPVHAVKSICLLKMERYEEAAHYYDELPPEIVVPGEETGVKALAYALMGDAKKAKEYKDKLEDQAKAPNGFTADSYLFLLAGATFQRDFAFEWVENAMNNRSPLLLLRFSDPLVNKIKEDLRYLSYQEKLFPKDLFQTDPKQSSKKALLDAGSATKIKEELLKLLEDKEAYLDPELSLRSLAEQLNIHPNQLSWLLNEELGKNFNQFINHYRIEAFKRIAAQPENSHLTILAIAYDCGFNSKTVFNTYFKKECGMTPKEYLNNLDS